MIIHPSEQLAAHLAEQNVKEPVGGYEIFDAEYLMTKGQMRHAHPMDTPQELQDRVDYFLIWKHYGVQQNDGTKGAELQNAQKVGVLTEEFRRMNAEHMPRISEAVRASSVAVVEAVHKSKDEITLALQSLQSATRENLQLVSTNANAAANMRIAHLDNLAKRAIKGFAWLVALLGCILVTLVVLTVFSYRAHAQTGLDGARVSAGGVQKQQWMAGIAKFDFGSGLAVVCSAGTCTVTATGVSGSLATTSLTDFSGTAATSSGQIPIWDNGTHTYIPGDPLVQGLFADASTSKANPVLMGGWDGTNLRASKSDASGNWSIVFAAPQHVIVDSSASIAVTGTFWQTTQPVSGTFWQTTQPVSGPVTDTQLRASPVQVQSNSANIATETTLGGIKTGTDRIPAQGQALAAASLPVVLTALQLAAITPPSAITNFANETGGNLASVKTNTDALGAKTDAKSTATDATSTSAISILKQISASVQAPPSQAVTGPLTDTQLRATAVPVSLATAPTTAVTNTGLTDLDGAIAANAAAPPANVVATGGVGSGATGGLMTRMVACDLYAPISLTTNTQLITGTSGRTIYICAINMVVGAATNVAVVAGTGTVCATGIAGIFGGTTAATGWNFAANGGIAQGTGLGMIGKTASTGQNLCILVSAANQVSGGISYTVF